MANALGQRGIDTAARMMPALWPPTPPEQPAWVQAEATRRARPWRRLGLALKSSLKTGAANTDGAPSLANPENYRWGRALLSVSSCRSGNEGSESEFVRGHTISEDGVEPDFPWGCRPADCVWRPGLWYAAVLNSSDPGQVTLEP